MSPQPHGSHKTHIGGKQKEIRDDDGNIIDRKDNCNIYIAGIPLRTTEDNLRKIFSPFGSILNVHIVKDY